MNEFTTAEIKESVEYQWRIAQTRIFLALFGIMSLFGFIVVTIVCSRIKLPIEEVLKYFLIAMLATEIFFVVLFFPSVLFYYLKAKRLITTYSEYKSYVVTLDKPSTSYSYRGAVYYTVHIRDDKISKLVETNPYFSSSFFSKFELEEYNNKTVVGLYDEKKDKFYILKKV